MLVHAQSFALFSLFVMLVNCTIVPPALKGAIVANTGALDASDTTTDTETIVSTVNAVDQKAGATDDTPPNQTPPDTVVTATDGVVVDSASNSTRRALAGRAPLLNRTPGRFSRAVEKRASSNYEQVFAGSGTPADRDRDGSIQGTAYLTYTVVDNSTYNVDACLAFCDRVPGCVFVNLYYEFNNQLLDFVFSEHSNLKCAAYADIHTAAEKTNLGGQQSEDLPAGLTYIENSSGYALKTLAEPDAPDGYELVFGPTGGANNAPGYMGFAFLDKYDVQACADQCNTRGADSNGGGCQYFNIWRALVDGVPTTYTCSMYFIPSDESTAVNYGQGDLKVTYSRGYRRISAVADGGFEQYKCSDGSDFCFTESYSQWTGISSAGGQLDASFFHYTPYAHSGDSVALLGAAANADTLSGTIKPASSLNTVGGKKYSIQFFHNSLFSGQAGEQNAFVKVFWNGDVVLSLTPGFQPWTFYEVEVTAKSGGKDLLSFQGGKAPSWSFIDDVNVFLA